MWISGVPPVTSPSLALGDAVAVLRDTAGTLWAAQPDDELVAVVELVQQVLAAAAAVEARALAEAGARQSAPGVQGALVTSGSGPI